MQELDFGGPINEAHWTSIISSGDNVRFGAETISCLPSSAKQLTPVESMRRLKIQKLERIKSLRNVLCYYGYKLNLCKNM